MTAFVCAQINGVFRKSNKDKQMVRKDWLKVFYKSNQLFNWNLENCSMTSATEFNKAQI